MVEKLTNHEVRRSGKASNNRILAVKMRTERNRLAPLKILIVMLLVVIQAAILICTHLFLLALFKWYIALSLFLSVTTAIYILSSNKNSSSKAVWVMFVLVFFLFGFFVYFLSDDRISFFNSRKKYKKIYEKSERFLAPAQEFEIKNKRVESGCTYLKTAGNFETYSNTDAKYFPSGTRLFDQILEDLKKAEQFIFIEYFIISDGILFERVLDILKQKASAGVDVRIIYDDLGSMRSLSHKTKKQLKKAGIKYGKFNPLVSRFSVALNFRDHRKIVVVDGKVAFTGGANLADEYVNEKQLHGYWKDSGIRIEGPAVDTFTLAFLRQWQFVKKEEVDYKNFMGNAVPKEAKSVVVPFVDGLNYTNRIGKGIVENMLSNANEKIWIMTPYFIPDDTISNLLMQKAMSGVDVRIILPEIADKKMVYIASRSNAEKLIEYGVKIFTLKNSFVHSKVVLTESSALVGSINIDLRSFYQQFESAIFTDDKDVLSDVNLDFNNVLLACRQIKSKNNKLSNRMVAGVLRIIMPFM